VLVKYRLVWNVCVFGNFLPRLRIKDASPYFPYDAAVVDRHDVWDTFKTQLKIGPMRRIPENISERQTLFFAVLPSRLFQIAAYPNDSP